MNYSAAAQPPVLPPATNEEPKEAPASAVEPAASTSTKPKGAAGKKKRTKEADDDATGQSAAKSAKGKAGARPSQASSSSNVSTAKAASKGTDSKPMTAPSTPKLASEPASAAEPSAYAKMMGMSGAPRLGGLGNMKFKKGGDSKPTEIKSFPSAPISIEDVSEAKPVEPAPAIRELPKPKEEDPREAIALRNKQRADMKKRMEAVEKNKFDLLRQSVDMHKFDESFGIQRKVWTGDVDEKYLHQYPDASIARDKPKSLPYPMQYGSGFWLSADQPAPAQAAKR